MTHHDFTDFASKRGITTTEVEGYASGGGYACTYIYYEPKSVIKLVEHLEKEIMDLRQNITKNKDILQCNSCDIKTPHDVHCFLCSAPIIASHNRFAYLTKDKQSSVFCKRKECQEYADCKDEKFGLFIYEEH